MPLAVLGRRRLLLSDFADVCRFHKLSCCNGVYERVGVITFRNRLGQRITPEAAEAMIKTEGLEVARHSFTFDNQQIMISSRLQPVCNTQGHPLFLTLIFGDKERGLQELPTNSEDECRKLHYALLDRYLLVERERRSGTPRVLLDGTL